MTEYRQDDRTDEGYCPKCGQPVTTVFVDGGGWCPDHGRVWCDWTPPRTASGTECVVCGTVIEPEPRYFTDDGKPRHMLCDERE